jgi:hypothetical protein
MDPAVQDESGMWTVSVRQYRLGMLTTGAIRVVTGPIRSLFLPGGQPWRIQLSGGSEPEGTDSAGGWCWQSHQVPPGQSS